MIRGLPTSIPFTGLDMAIPYNINVVIDEPDQDRWTDFHHAGHGAWEQAWAYGEAMRSLGSVVRRVRVTTDNETIAIAQILERGLLGYLGFASCSRGPIWGVRAQGDVALRKDCLVAVRQALRNRLLHVTAFTPEFDDRASHAGEEYACFRQIMTGLSTVVLDLTRPLADIRSGMETRWRNRLSYAERHWRGDLNVGSSLSGLRTLLRLEEQQRRSRKFNGMPVALVERYVEASGTTRPSFVMARANQKMSCRQRCYSYCTPIAPPITSGGPTKPHEKSICTICCCGARYPHCASAESSSSTSALSIPKACPAFHDSNWVPAVGQSHYRVLMFEMSPPER